MPGGIRQTEQRRVRAEDRRSGVTLHNAYASSDPPTSEGGAVWGSPVPCSGADELAVYVDFTLGNSSGFHVLVQDSLSEAEGEFHDRYELDRTASAITPRRFALNYALSADAKVSFRVPVIAPFMRLKVWADTDGTDARIIAQGARVTRAS